MFINYALSPRHPLVAKPLDERRNQYKLQAYDVCPQPTQPWVISSEAGTRLLQGEARQESGSAGPSRASLCRVPRVSWCCCPAQTHADFYTLHV